MLALLATHLAGMGAFLTVPVLAPAIAAETGLPLGLVGFHTALVYAGALVTGPMTAGLVRRHGGVRVLQGALLVIACGIALAAIGTPWALVASALVAGAGHGPVTPGGSQLIAARTPPRRRALVFSLKQTGVPAGAMLVAAAAPPWQRWPAGGGGAGDRGDVPPRRRGDPAAARAAGCGAGPEGRRRRPGRLLRESAGTLGLLRHHPALLRLTLMSCAYGIAQFCFLTFFVAFQVASLGTGLAEAGLLLAAAQVMGVLGRIGWALAADRWGARPVLVLCGLGAAAGGTVLALAGPAGRCCRCCWPAWPWARPPSAGTA
jgi:MFS family permease